MKFLLAYAGKASASMRFFCEKPPVVGLPALHGSQKYWIVRCRAIAHHKAFYGVPLFLNSWFALPNI